MQITTWNVNSLRSRVELVAEYLDQEEPDVLAIQETKCTDKNFVWNVFTDRGYEVTHHGAGQYGGVALASQVGLERVQWGFSGEHGPPFDEPRLLAADCGDLRVVTVYVPNGRIAGSAHWQYKLAWFELLRVELELELEESDDVIAVGDFNVCPTPADLYQPTKRNRNLVTDQERSAIARLLDLGFTDLARAAHPDADDYTWFSFRPGAFEANLGYRLDLALGTAAVVDRLVDCRPASGWREPARKPSDHAPLTLILT